MCAASPSEDATCSEMAGDPVMHVIDREPIHPIDCDAQALDDALADVIPAQRLTLIFGIEEHCADEPSASFTLHREDRQKVGVVECDVQLAVHRWAGRRTSAT